MNAPDFPDDNSGIPPTATTTSLAASQALALTSLAFDFDGVIHRYSKGWHDHTIYDSPIDGAFEALHELMAKGYCVFILTARPAEQVIHWCREFTPRCMDFRLIPKSVVYWDMQNVVGVTNRKLPARFYVDDRALRFTNWTDTLNYFR